MSKVATFILAIAIAALMCGFARADDVPGSDWMPRDQVARKLEAAGYSTITGLKADDNFWKGKAVHNGKIVKFRVDPKTGEVRSEKLVD
jgi:hypothetical protein